MDPVAAFHETAGDGDFFRDLVLRGQQLAEAKGQEFGDAEAGRDCDEQEETISVAIEFKKGGGEAGDFDGGQSTGGHAPRWESSLFVAGHALGCLITLKSGEIDFDFGDLGEIDGFDAYRLSLKSETPLAGTALALAPCSPRESPVPDILWDSESMALPGPDRPVCMP